MPEITAVGLLVFAIACLFVLKLVKILRGDGCATSGSNEDDARLVQETHQGMERLERRVEALETILLDSARSGGETRR